MLSGGIISVLKWLKIGPFSNNIEVEEVAPIEPPLTIKMDKLSIPIFADERVAATILIELEVEVLGTENRAKTMKQLPRLTDAFFKDLYVFVPQLIRRKTKLTTTILAARMQKIANKLLGNGVLNKVIITKVSDS